MQTSESFTIVSSGKKLPPPEKKTIPEYALEKAKHFAENGRSAYMMEGLSGEKRYFKDLEDQTRRIASHFYKKGLRRGDIVVYNTSHQIHQTVLMLGVWRANGVMRSLYADESSEIILQKLTESNARWIFCDAENAPTCQEIANQAPWPVEVVICGQEENGFKSINEYYEDNGESCPALEITEDDIAVILPTSGTTGASKGAIHTHKGFLTHVRLWNLFEFSYPEPNLIASKGTHISGTLFPISLLCQGKLGIVFPRVNKEILVQSVDKYKPKLVFAFPTFLLALGSLDAQGYDITSVETIIIGGTPVTSEMKKALYALPRVKTINVVYGLTESPTFATTADFTNGRSKVTYPDTPDSSVGKPYPGGEIQIRDLDTLEVLGPNKKGEVCARGEFLFSGYYKNPHVTKDAFVEGWFRSGDVGYVDDNGFLFIVDRAKDIFKYFHNHISPTELESVIGKHPQVKEVCVFPVPDEGGEVPRAFVVLKNPKGQNLSEVAKDIKKFADDKLATYKQLKGGLYVVQELPTGKTGKVARSIVSQMELPSY